MEAVVWEGSGAAWPGVGWGAPVELLLSRWRWRVGLVPWGDPGTAHRGRPGVLHVFSGGEEPVGSGSPEMTDRLAAVADALHVAASGGCRVLGICLGAQMIAAVADGRLPRAARGGGEAGIAAVRGHGQDDLVVPTAHVAEVPEEFLHLPGVRLLWSNDTTTVQGFALGAGVVGVQFHPELSAAEARWAARSFRRSFGAPPVNAPARSVDPERTLAAVLAVTGADAVSPGDIGGGVVLAAEEALQAV